MTALPGNSWHVQSHVQSEELQRWLWMRCLEAYQAWAPLTSHNGTTVTITRSAKLERALSCIQLVINDIAFRTRKKCLDVLGVLFFSRMHFSSTCAISQWNGSLLRVLKNGIVTRTSPLQPAKKRASRSLSLLSLSTAHSARQESRQRRAKKRR